MLTRCTAKNEKYPFHEICKAVHFDLANEPNNTKTQFTEHE